VHRRQRAALAIAQIVVRDVDRAVAVEAAEEAVAAVDAADAVRAEDVRAAGIEARSQ